MILWPLNIRLFCVYGLRWICRRSWFPGFVCLYKFQVQLFVCIVKLFHTRNVGGDFCKLTWKTCFQESMLSISIEAFPEWPMTFFIWNQFPEYLMWLLFLDLKSTQGDAFENHDLEETGLNMMLLCFLFSSKAEIYECLHTHTSTHNTNI